MLNLSKIKQYTAEIPQKGHYSLCFAFDKLQILSKIIKQYMNEIPQKATCRQHLSQIGQEIAEEPQKGCFGLCLAFDFKGHKTNCQQWPQS